MVELGKPADMAKDSTHEVVRRFLNRAPRSHAGKTV
jgi:hypothetical protein